MGIVGLTRLVYRRWSRETVNGRKKLKIESRLMSARSGVHGSGPPGRWMGSDNLRGMVKGHESFIS